MTGRLEVGLDCGFNGDPERGVLTHLVGNIYATERGGRSLRGLALPLGWDASPVGYDLPAGRYVVEASLPSGEILSEDVEVVDGRTAQVLLGVVGSPHESHTLQYVVGNIESAAVYHAPGTYPVPNSHGSQSYLPAPTTVTGGGGAWEEPADGETDREPVVPSPVPPPAAQPPPPPPREPGWAQAEPPGAVPPGPSPSGAEPPVGPPPQPAAARVVLFTGGHTAPPGIADLVALNGSGGGVADLLGATAPVEMSPIPGDPVAPLYRFAEPGSLATDATGAERLHHYLLVSTGVEDHLVTLPWPWSTGEGRPAAVEVLVNLRQSPTGSAVSVAVRDPVVGGGLGYLAAGALDRAAVVLSDVEAMLYGKVRNPLSAAAGGYVLVGTESTGEPRPWDPWLGNLRDWYPHLPDGAVLLGTRMLRTARDDAQADAARAVLLEAFGRGLPVYTLGLTWLMDGLSVFPEDPACAEAMQQVRRLAWRVDLREPFTVVRLGGAT